MMKTKAVLEILLNELEERLKKCEAELAASPEGMLYQVRRGRQTELYHAIRTADGALTRRSITQQPEMAALLARKEYLKEEIRILQQNVKNLRKFQTSYTETTPDHILACLPNRYQHLPEDWFLSAQTVELQDEIDQWARATFRQSDYLTEKKTKCTSRGLWVRTMAEVVWAERLYHHEVAFRYEQVLEIGEYTFSPDFTVKRRADGKIWYIEHCGMPHDPAYLQKHNWKIEMYRHAGIVPWENLIITYGDIDGNVDVRVIESEIVNKLL